MRELSVCLQLWAYHRWKLFFSNRWLMPLCNWSAKLSSVCIFISWFFFINTTTCVICDGTTWEFVLVLVFECSKLLLSDDKDKVAYLSFTLWLVFECCSFLDFFVCFWMCLIFWMYAPIFFLPIDAFLLISFLLWAFTL